MTTSTTTTPTDSPLDRLLDPVAAARFWDNVRIGGRDDCWYWIPGAGTRESTGHIRIWHNGIKVYAHRVAYLLAGGQIDDGEVVMHSVCDRGDCMNYLHMRAGSNRDNTLERDQKNRRTPFLPRGERHWSSKLTDADAARIRAAKGLGLSAHALATLYNVSRSSIYSIWGGLRYPCLLQDEASDPADDDP